MKVLFIIVAAAVSAMAFVAQPKARISTKLSFSPTDYSHTIHTLAKELHKTHEDLKRIEILAARLQEMERKTPQIAKVRDATLQRAVAEAKAAMERYGAGSTQTKEAFRVLERIKPKKEDDDDEVSFDLGIFPSFLTSRTNRYSESSVNAHHEFDKIIDKELLRECMVAIETLLSLERFVAVEEKRLGNDEHKYHQVQDSTPGMPWGKSSP